MAKESQFIHLYMEVKYRKASVKQEISGLLRDHKIIPSPYSDDESIKGSQFRSVNMSGIGTSIQTNNVVSVLIKYPIPSGYIVQMPLEPLDLSNPNHQSQSTSRTSISHDVSQDTN